MRHRHSCDGDTDALYSRSVTQLASQPGSPGAARRAARARSGREELNRRLSVALTMVEASISPEKSGSQTECV